MYHFAASNWTAEMEKEQKPCSRPALLLTPSRITKKSRKALPVELKSKAQGLKQNCSSVQTRPSTKLTDIS